MDQHHHTGSHDNSPPPPPTIPAYANQPPQAPPYDKRPRHRPPRKKRNPLLMPLILVSVIAVVMSGLYFATLVDSTRPDTTLSEAVDSCDVDPDSPYLYVADGGESLIMTSEGNESAGAPIEEIACVFLELDVPSSIVNRFDTTRALDGTQSGTWDQFEATWNYHPDSGSNVTITVVDD